jgi:calcium-dependent protein kinase
LWTAKSTSGDPWKEYSKGKKLGAGLSGAVFEATHKQSGEKFACKVVYKMKLRPELQQMLQQEIDLLRHVDHPNVIQLFETFEDPENIYLVLELASGGELFDSLVNLESGHYTEAHAAHVFWMMLLSVRHCHQQKILHRDLKLENFIFESKAYESQLKLIDFGLSKKFGQREQQRRVGTCYYMAPEVLDKQIYEPACDVWGLGVLLYMMLTGVPPFEGETDKDIRAAVKAGKYNWDVEEEFNMTISAQAKDLVAKMLTYDYKKRTSLAEVMKHPWLEKRMIEDKDNHDHKLSKSVAGRIRNFGHFNEIKRVAVEMVALQLTPKQIQDLRAEFIRLDADGSGFISLDEFKVGMSGKEGSDSEFEDDAKLQELFDRVDEGHDGKLSYHEFLAAAVDHNAVTTINALDVAFKKFGLEAEDGMIHKDKLHACLLHLYNEEQVKVLVSEVPFDGEGHITVKAFKESFEDHHTRTMDIREMIKE